MQQRFDVMLGVNDPKRVLQAATQLQIDAYCEKHNFVMLPGRTRQLGNFLKEAVIVGRNSAYAAEAAA